MLITGLSQQHRLLHQQGGGVTFIGVVWCEAGNEVPGDMSGEVDELPSSCLLPERLV